MHAKLSRALLSLCCCGRTYDEEEEDDDGEAADRSSATRRWVFSLKELESATNRFNFDNMVGDGPLATVYWGQLPDSSQVAVKRLKAAGATSEAAFGEKMEKLGRVTHRNLLSLRGYCAEGRQHRLLVYDYMPNLSLYAHLHGVLAGDLLLHWRRRMAIAGATARGILHLHCRETPPVFHGDVRASNVLLDADFQARVADFGLASLILEGSVAAHNSGYLAPEQKASASGDVYSFGVLLLELASGRKPVGIRTWALPLARENKFEEIADRRLKGEYVAQELRRMVLAGLACTQRQPGSRPAMLEVIALLRGDSSEQVLKLENAALVEVEPEWSFEEAVSLSSSYPSSGDVSETDS